MYDGIQKNCDLSENTMILYTCRIRETASFVQARYFIEIGFENACLPRFFFHTVQLCLLRRYVLVSQDANNTFENKIGNFCKKFCYKIDKKKVG